MPPGFLAGSLKQITIKNLSKNGEGANFEYDGMNFKQVIKTLETRICKEKVKELAMNPR